MANLIDKDLLFKELSNYPVEFGLIQESHVKDAINSLPVIKYTQTIEPTGEWVWEWEMFGGETAKEFCYCSVCGKGHFYSDFRYCPNCGAKLLG